MAERNIYLNMKSLAEARLMLAQAFDLSGRLATEVLPVTDAVGRMLCEPVWAKVSSPNFHAAAMDGIAVLADQTYGAGESTPKWLEAGKNAWFINTGQVMPENTNAVIIIENLHIDDNGGIEIQAPVFPWQNVRRVGEDIVATELLFPRNEPVTPYAVGALLTAGIFEVAVWKKPSVLIQPTGSELVSHLDIDPAALAPGQVIDSNSHMLGKLVESCGGRYTRNAIIRDDVDVISDAVREAAKHPGFDIILMIGGSSAGSEDFARHVIERHGRVLFHGVAMMPGKPVIAGTINGKPVFGIPGYPVSAIIAFEQLVRPLICNLLNRPEPPSETLAAYPTKKIASRLGVEEFVRVKLGKVGDRIVATPLARGAGSITSITEADGIIRIPDHVEGVPDGRPATAHLLKSAADIKNTIVSVGSHDNTLDVLADLIRAGNSPYSLSSSHVGSMGGLMAVKKGLCHMAGTHLLDTTDGTYNIRYIQKYLPGTPTCLLHLVRREQGLMIRPGNPKQIRGIGDLVRDDVIFINRQGGSGTRILLDYELERMKISPRDIAGYPNEEFTHMAVAVAVLSGTADAGLGIYAAAAALGLDFIPVVTESYELLIPSEYMETDMMRLLADIIRSDAFKARVKDLGGYHTEKTGEIVWTGP
jgi:putative molybdopterin biosynthesis protein